MSLVLLILGGIGHTILWVALVNRIHGLGIGRRHVDLLTYVCAVGCAALPLLVAAALWHGGVAFPPATWTSFLIASWGYVLVCGLICVAAAAHNLYLILHPERSGAMLTNHTSVVDIRERAAEPLAAPGVPAMIARLPGNEIFQLSVHKKDISLKRFPRDNPSIRLAHISDLHMSGRVDKTFFAEMVDEVNALEADLVVVTGDIVERPRCLDWIPETVGRLQAEHGIYFVLGNHDERAGADELRQRLIDAGLVHLGGKCLEVEVRGTPILMAGNERPWFGPLPEMTTAAQRGKNGLPLRILAAHTPDQFHYAEEHDFDLMLAGHNHGGQVRVPLVGALLAPSLHGTRYSCGVFRRGNTVLHVSRGTASLFPYRWNCPPEISLLTLRASGA